MGRMRDIRVRGVLWVLALPVWIVGVALVVFGDRASGSASPVSAASCSLPSSSLASTTGTRNPTTHRRS